jgi:hypothetical protein
MIKLITLLFLLSTNCFAASGSANVSQVITLDNVSSTTAPFATSLTDFKTNYTNYVTLGAGMNSTTIGNNYYFTSGNPTNGNGAYSVPAGKTLVVYSISAQGAAVVGFGLASSSTTPTEDSATVPSGVIGYLGYTGTSTNGGLSQYTAAGLVWTRFSPVLQFQAGSFPFFHSFSTNAINVIMQGIYVP